jgi:hypothetical protein
MKQSAYPGYWRDSDGNTSESPGFSRGEDVNVLVISSPKANTGTPQGAAPKGRSLE